MRFLAVVVIATTCPPILAIPVAVIGATSLSAKHAIIIKNPAALEQITTCRTLIFDKTGTLTYGKPARVMLVSGYLEPIEGAILQEIIDLAAVVNAVRVAIPSKELADF
jgi:P-type E1-E2 ATPase